MFDSLRDRIHTVQEGLTASFRGLSVGEGSRRSRQTSGSCNYNSGGDLLHKYQTAWSELHQNAEENAKRAEEVDQQIGQLHDIFEKQWSNVTQIYSQLASLPELAANIQDTMEKIGALQGLFEEVEGAFLTLQDTVETQDLQEKQLDHRFQLALYKEKRLGELEQLKASLAADHMKKVRDYEQSQQTLLKERQEAFKEAFEEEMEHYKLHGKVAKVDSASGTTRQLSLDEVTVDVDSHDLDAFLAEEATEETVGAVDNQPASGDTVNESEVSE